MTLRHCIAHVFGWNRGTVIALTIERKSFVGFYCDGCGSISDLVALKTGFLAMVPRTGDVRQFRRLRTIIDRRVDDATP